MKTKLLRKLRQKAEEKYPIVTTKNSYILYNTFINYVEEETTSLSDKCKEYIEKEARDYRNRFIIIKLREEKAKKYRKL